MDTHVDTILMWMALLLLVVVGILGATRTIDLDDQKHRYPDSVTVPSVMPTVYAPAP